MRLQLRPLFVDGCAEWKGLKTAIWLALKGQDVEQQRSRREREKAKVRCDVRSLPQTFSLWSHISKSSLQVGRLLTSSCITMLEGASGSESGYFCIHSRLVVYLQSPLSSWGMMRYVTAITMPLSGFWIPHSWRRWSVVTGWPFPCHPVPNTM